MICNKCGNEVKDGEKFCSKCGKKVKNNSQRKKGSKLIYILIPIVSIIIVIVGIVLVVVNNKEIMDNENMTYSNSILDNEIENDITYNERNIIQQNTKYTSKDLGTNYLDSIEGFDKTKSTIDTYIIFNNQEFEFNIEYQYNDVIEQSYCFKIKGNYEQDENNITFTMTGGEIIAEVDGTKKSETLNEIEQVSFYGKLLDDGKIIIYSNETDNEKITFEKEGHQEVLQGSSTNKSEKQMIANIIDAYAKITTQYDGYDLQYMGYTQYARSKNGINVYMIRYLARSSGMSTGLEYCRLVSLNSTNTMIDKKSEFCKWATNSGAAQSSPLLEIQYKQIWGN